MSTNTLIPTTIHREAADFAAQRGVEAQLTEIVDQVKLIVPGVSDMTVEYAPAYDSGDAGILIHARRDVTQPSNQDCWERFSAWKTARFAPEIWRHFNLVLSSDNQHGG
jgi:hypothetical protein